MSGGYINHAVVIDTVNDEALGDCGEPAAPTVGVAVRPSGGAATTLKS